MSELSTPEARGVDTWVFVVSCALSMLGLIPSVLFLIFNLRFRKVRLIKMSSPNLNMVISVGGLLSYLSLLLWGVEAFSGNHSNLSTIACTMRTWTLPVSFSLVFGSLLVKSWRVRKIFESAPATKVIIKDGKLFMFLLGLILLDLIFLAIWQLSDPLESSWITTTTTTHSGSLNDLETISATYLTCGSEYTSLWWSILLVYKTFLLLYASYLSWAIRAVTIPSMNDSVAIIISCLVTTFTGTTTAAICLAFTSWPNVTSSVTMGAIWIVTTITLSVVNIPKIHMWWKKTDEEMMNIHVTSQVISSPSQSLDQVEGEIYHLVAENKTLRKSLAEKEQTIKELQSSVATVKEKLHELLLREDSKQDSGLDLSSSSDLQINETNPGHEVLGDIIPNGVVGHDNRGSEGVSNEGQKVLSKLSLFRVRKHHCRGSLPSRSRHKSKGRKSSSTRGGSVRENSPRKNRLPSGSKHSGTTSSEQHSSAPSTAPPPSKIRDSISDIAHHMNVMDSLANQLQASITLDVVRHVTSASDHGVSPSLPVTPLPYGGGCGGCRDCYHTRYQVNPICSCCAGSRVPYITGSIVDSYNMDNDSDTVSYVSNHLSNGKRSSLGDPNHVTNTRQYDVTENSPPDVVTSQHEVLQDFVGSRDNLIPPEQQVYTLGSDMYYPDSEPSSSDRYTDKSTGGRGGGKKTRTKHHHHHSGHKAKRSGRTSGPSHHRRSSTGCKDHSPNGSLGFVGPLVFDDSFV